jgi:aerobic C4-dicarboxylate transport protein
MAPESDVMEGSVRIGVPPASAHRPWYTILYVQVLIAIGIGVAVGYFDPKLGVSLKPLGDAFIALIRMMIAPVIFCTIVHGIASMGDLRKVGRVGIKTLFYVEAVSTLARHRTHRRRGGRARQGLQYRSGDPRSQCGC